LRKYKKIIFTISLFLFISISGCLEEPENKKYEIMEYSVETLAYSFQTGWISFGEGLHPDLIPEIADHDPPYFADEYSKAKYVINGTVKNTGNVKVNSFILTMDFYTVNGTLLFSKQINNLSRFEPGEIWKFKYEYNHNDNKYEKYFLNVKNMTIYSGIQSKELGDIN
jgi:hypothetical protein